MYVHMCLTSSTFSLLIVLLAMKTEELLIKYLWSKIEYNLLVDVVSGHGYHKRVIIALYMTLTT